MDKVYLVKDGEYYDDYRIDAAFSTEEKAEEYRRKFGCRGLEVYDLDKEYTPIKPGPKEGFEFYKIRLDKFTEAQQDMMRDAISWIVTKIELADWPEYHIRTCPRTKDNDVNFDKDYMIFYIEAKSEEDAKQQTIDKVNEEIETQKRRFGVAK